MSMISDANYPFIQSKNYKPTNGRQMDLIVIHTMESSEKPGTARAVANWFAGSSAPMASAHFCVDSSEIIQCVHEEDIAYGAPGANSNGIHIEMAGRATQTADDWSDELSTSIITNAATLTAKLCNDFNIPMVFIDDQDLISGQRGITTHAAVSKAFKKSTHWDPGPNFPIDKFIDLVIQS